MMGLISHLLLVSSQVAVISEKETVEQQTPSLRSCSFSPKARWCWEARPSTIYWIGLCIRQWLYLHLSMTLLLLLLAACIQVSAIASSFFWFLSTRNSNLSYTDIVVALQVMTGPTTDFDMYCIPVASSAPESPFSSSSHSSAEFPCAGHQSAFFLPK